MTTEDLKSWWRGLGTDRKLMLAAIAVDAVSQFLLYRKGGSGGYLTGAMDLDHYTGIVLDMSPPAGTGWQLHTLAAATLLALAVVYLTKACQAALWARWGWWASCVLLFLTMTPGEPFRAPGAMIGLAAFGLAIWAALVHRKATPAATPAPGGAPDPPKEG